MWNLSQLLELAINSILNYLMVENLSAGYRRTAAPLRITVLNNFRDPEYLWKPGLKLLSCLKKMPPWKSIHRKFAPHFLELCKPSKAHLCPQVRTAFSVFWLLPKQYREKSQTKGLPSLTLENKVSKDKRIIQKSIHFRKHQQKVS